MSNLLIIIALISAMGISAVYSFLPSKFQNKTYIRNIAILSSLTVLIWGVLQLVNDYNDRIYAQINSDGEVLNSKNFPWEIEVTNNNNENLTIYILKERYGDSSLISIKVKKPHPKYEIYNAMGGVGIKFYCKKDDLSDFWVYVTNP